MARIHPEVFATAMAGFIGILLGSWELGERLCAMDGWPDILPYSADAVAALQDVGLLDSESQPNATGWGNYFGEASRRREEARNRWRRSKANQPPRGNGDDPRGSAGTPRGNGDDPRGFEPPFLPSVPTYISPPTPSQAEGATDKVNPRAKGDSPRQRGDSPRHRAQAVRDGLLAAFEAMGGMKSMPLGLRAEPAFVGGGHPPPAPPRAAAEVSKSTEGEPQ
jgi:hypothetical protein